MGQGRRLFSLSGAVHFFSRHAKAATPGGEQKQVAKLGFVALPRLIVRPTYFDSHMFRIKPCE